MSLKQFALLLGALLFQFNANSQKVQPEDITGTWLTADKTGEITISRRADRYIGTITAGDSEQKFDIHNPDDERHGDPLIGLIILKDLKFDEDNQVWEDGTVYDPKNGKRYSCHIKLLNINKLKITGFIGFSWIGRSEEWERIK